MTYIPLLHKNDIDMQCGNDFFFSIRKLVMLTLLKMLILKYLHIHLSWQIIPVNIKSVEFWLNMLYGNTENWKFSIKPGYYGTVV